MIDPIRHYSLLTHVTVHDEEALTSLDLAGRTAGKVNEIVSEVNQQREELEQGLASIPDGIKGAIEELNEDGTLRELVNETLYRDINERLGETDSYIEGALIEIDKDLDDMDRRIGTLVASGTPTDGSSEVIDARIAADGSSYNSMGQHIRAIATGAALKDALRPGTIRHGRISAGMLMGALGQRYVIGEQWTTAGKWTGKGYVDPETLAITEHSSYQYTEPVPCEYGDTFRVFTGIYGNKIPAAIFYDADKRIVGTSPGDIGTSNWDPAFHYVQVDRDAAYVSFQCGTPAIAEFRVLKYTPRLYPDPLEAMGGRGYIRANAYKRTDTVTDRAQIKMWFPITEGQSFRFRVEPLLMKNVSGWTARYFAASDDKSYSRSLPESDTGRSYSASLAIASDVTIPEHTGEEQPFTHLAVFIDLIPINGDQRIDATIAPPTLYTRSGNTYIVNRAEPLNVSLHGAVDGDYIAVVPAGAMASACWRKTVTVEGDSLTRGNTLPKTASWFNIACSSRDMIYVNNAVNGQALSDIQDKDWTGLDYFVLQGGANDKRLGKTLEEFTARIKAIVGRVRAQSPQCKILLMTNWRRTTDANSLGLYDSDYVVAMLAAAEELGVLCINNYAHSLNLLDPAIAAWADEGIVSSGSANIHFSEAGNKWLAPRFLAALESL